MAKRFAQAIETYGWSVWWDPKLRAGERFDDVIEEALKAAKSVIVMWSKLSVKSPYVRDEATYALNRNKLIQVLLDQTELPLRFTGIHCADLKSWEGERSHPGFQSLIDGLTSVLGVATDTAESRAYLFETSRWKEAA